MAEQNPAIFLQGGSHPAEDVRRFISTVAGDRPGIVGAGDLAVTQTGTTSMAVSVAAGRAFIEGTENAYQGLYFVENRGAKTLTITPSDATNDRLDLVVARVKDAAYSGTLSEWALEVIPGTAQPTPEEPAVPENALVLAKVTVHHGATSITGADIEDRRLTTLGQGMATGLHGVLVATSSTLPASGDFEGQHAWETDTDRARVWDGTRWHFEADRVVVANAAARDALTGYAGLQAFLLSDKSTWVYDGSAWGRSLAEDDTGEITFTPVAPITVGPNGAHYRRVGKVVEVVLESTYNGSYTNNQTLFTLPVGFRPQQARFFQGVAYGGAAVAWDVNAAGAIQYAGPTQTYSGFLLMGTFLVA